MMKRILKYFAWLVVDHLNRRAYNAQKFKGLTARPFEYAFALDCLAGACPRTVLDVGPGKSPWPAIMAYCGFRVVAIDEVKGYWKRAHCP